MNIIEKIDSFLTEEDLGMKNTAKNQAYFKENEFYYDKYHQMWYYLINKSSKSIKDGRPMWLVFSGENAKFIAGPSKVEPYFGYNEDDNPSILPTKKKPANPLIKKVEELIKQNKGRLK